MWQRSDGQRFRERLGFLLLCFIAFYYVVLLLINFKPVLEPLLWAVVFVCAIDPLVSFVEDGILSVLSACSLVRRGHNRWTKNTKSSWIWSVAGPGSGTTSAILEIDKVDEGKQGSTTTRGHYRFSRSLAKYASIIIVLTSIVTVGVVFFFFVLQSARRMREHWSVYEQGAANLRKALSDFQHSLATTTGASVETIKNDDFLASATSVSPDTDSSLRSRPSATASTASSTASEQSLTTGASSLLSTKASKQAEHLQHFLVFPFSYARGLMQSSGVESINYDAAAHELLTTVQDLLYTLLGTLLNNVSSLLLGLGMTTLYTLFWLLGRPLAGDEDQYVASSSTPSPTRVDGLMVRLGDGATSVVRNDYDDQEQHNRNAQDHKHCFVSLPGLDHVVSNQYHGNDMKAMEQGTSDRQPTSARPEDPPTTCRAPRTPREMETWSTASTSASSFLSSPSACSDSETSVIVATSAECKDGGAPASEEIDFLPVVVDRDTDTVSSRRCAASVAVPMSGKHEKRREHLQEVQVLDEPLLERVGASCPSSSSVSLPEKEPLLLSRIDRNASPEMTANSTSASSSSTSTSSSSRNQQLLLMPQLRKTFRRYLLLKSICCFGFGLAVGIWLSALGIDLAAAFGAITFVMNYVPEIGPFISILLPTPIILLDSRLERPLFTLFLAVVGQAGLKFAFANVVEVKLIENDRKLRMHPVTILLSVALWGHVWGPTGMLLSVPLMAFLKISLLSDVVPASYRDPVLMLLEGTAKL
ncbi:unnamed protein product [Amoebophrya sp. A25]|nr:unnamed protein product [Amoebophrya sp. A25]|eukprot:GSA25T00012318001.1